jgi:hypothetical protein
MICSSCKINRKSLFRDICLICLKQKAKDKEMEQKVKEIELREERKKNERITQMKEGKRTKEDILAEIHALSSDVSDEGRKKEAELFAELRKARLLSTL